MKATGKVMEVDSSKEIAALTKRLAELELIVGKLSNRIYRQEINSAPCGCGPKMSRR